MIDLVDQKMIIDVISLPENLMIDVVHQKMMIDVGGPEDDDRCGGENLIIDVLSRRSIIDVLSRRSIITFSPRDHLMIYHHLLSTTSIIRCGGDHIYHHLGRREDDDTCDGERSDHHLLSERR